MMSWAPAALAPNGVVGLVSHVDSWLEVGAARWGGGAVDPLGVVRERLCGSLPDDGAGVDGHAGDGLVDAVRVALIHQQAEREWELCWVGRRFAPHGRMPLGDRDVLLHQGNDATLLRTQVLRQRRDQPVEKVR